MTKFGGRGERARVGEWQDRGGMENMGLLTGEENGRAIESREGYRTKNAQKVHRESFYTYLNLSRIQVSIIYTHKLKKVTSLRAISFLPRATE